jgi:VanZ family protein
MNVLLSASMHRVWLLLWFFLATTLFLVPLPFHLKNVGGVTALPLDQAVHALAHFVLLGVAVWLSRWNGFSALATALCWACYGAGIEVIQSFTTYRHGQFIDWAYDLIGIVLGLAAYARTLDQEGLIRPRRGKKGRDRL